MDDRAALLGRFLTSRRARVSPSDVGLPGGGRRRVPGLRREEVAVLANVGTTWYTWLEQGRDVRPSEPVVGAIADALLLSDDERATLHALAGHAPAARRKPATVDRTVLDLVASLSPQPAVVHDHMYRILGFNLTHQHLAGDLGQVPVHRRNMVLLAFTEPGWIARVHDIDQLRRRMVAKLRSAYAETIDDPEWGPLLAALRDAAPDFDRMWRSGDVRRQYGETKRIDNPHVGELALTPLALAPLDDDRVRVVVEQPADPRTAERLGELDAIVRRAAVGPGTGSHLRVV